MVNYFGVKCVGREHTGHPMSVLQNYFDITEDWNGEKYIGLNLYWYYNQQVVHLFVTGYVGKARKEFSHEIPTW